MASVGGVTCQIVRPNAPPLKKQRVVTWMVAGLTGIGAHKLGLNDSEWEFELVKFGTSAQCNTWAAAIGALQATIVTIIDDHADTYTGMLIEKVSNPQKSVAVHVLSLGASGRRSTLTITGKIT